MSKSDDELFGLKSSRTGEYLHSEIADTLFEKLGYEKDIDVSYGLIRYNKDDNRFIRFIVEDKSVEANTIINNELYVLSINMQELQAINKKVKELRLDRRRR